MWEVLENGSLRSPIEFSTLDVYWHLTYRRFNAIVSQQTTPILAILSYLYKKIAHLMQNFLIKKSYL